MRDAVTLERLEYSILLDESGNKEYKKGPDVVFPTPTQKFFTRKGEAGEECRKFRAFELQSTNGIHVKVIAAYEDEFINKAGKKVKQNTKPVMKYSSLATTCRSTILARNTRR